MEQELTCDVCSEVYSAGTREPVVLPACGHTFCRSCVRAVENLRGAAGELLCPTCRTPHQGTPPAQLPTVFALLSLSEQSARKSEMSGPVCRSHGSPLEFWCQVCRTALCGHCLLEGHVRDGHAVLTTSEFLEDRRRDIRSHGRRLAGVVRRGREAVLEEVTKWMVRLARVSQVSSVLADAVTQAHTILHDVTTTARVEGVLVSSALMESLETEVKRVTAGELPAQPHDKGGGRRRCKSCSEPPTCPPQTPLTRQSSATDPQWQEASRPLLEEEDEESEETLKEEEEEDEDSEETLKGENEGQEMCAEAGRAEAMSEGSSGLGEPRVLQHWTLGEVNHVARDKEEGEEVLEDEEEEVDDGEDEMFNLGVNGHTWPFEVSVLGDKGRTGKMKWEDRGVHVYSLCHHHHHHHHPTVMLQVSLVEALLVRSERPLAFLDLSAGDVLLGRVYVRLWGHLRRARHFLVLCLGSLGPSYRGSKFHGAAKRGAPGETLAGGRYVTAEGSTSVQGLMGGLEWGGRHIRKKIEGLVVGASGGRPELDAFFHICTRAQPGRRFACAFGEVEAGMEVVRAAVAHLASVAVVITNAGVVLPATTKDP